MFFDIEHNNGPACSSCGENSNEVGVCLNCKRFADDSFKTHYGITREVMLTEVEEALTLEGKVEGRLSISIGPKGWTPDKIFIDYKLGICNNMRQLADEDASIENINFTVKGDEELLCKHFSVDEIEDLIRSAFYGEE